MQRLSLNDASGGVSRNCEMIRRVQNVSMIVSHFLSYYLTSLNWYILYEIFASPYPLKEEYITPPHPLIALHLFPSN